MADVYRSVVFEYDDERAMDLMPREPNQTDGFGRGLFPAAGPIKTVSASRTHRHEGQRRIAQFSYAWKGPAEILTEDFALRYATTTLISWVREQSDMQIEFSRANMMSAELDTEPKQPDRKDVTVEARVIAAELAVFSSLKPDDFV